jgi:uncharacterized 2Fe-2S/4Fe-4S cluster protein (DUF4445 family)
MTRIEFATAGRGQHELETLIRGQIGRLIKELLSAVEGKKAAQTDPPVTPITKAPLIESIVLVGNTVMHHLFSGISVEPLSHFPFVPETEALQTFSSSMLGWELPGDSKVHFLPCLGGFVGSDILAGVLATKLHERVGLAMLIDLGTNGEIVLGNRDRLLCAATAAGPAFEGARIRMGMRAATGAISEVSETAGQLHCRVLGKTVPRGICGSGLIDAIAVGLNLGWIKPNGRLANGESLRLADPVSLTQRDIRELQLAKGAIAAGVRLLLEQWGATPNHIEQVYLAGAFGNYINQANARRIGMINFPAEKIVPAGNTALLGAKLALFELQKMNGSYRQLQERTTHISLSDAAGFQDAYAEEMTFP